MMTDDTDDFTSDSEVEAGPRTRHRKVANAVYRGYQVRCGEFDDWICVHNMCCQHGDGSGSVSHRFLARLDGNRVKYKMVPMYERGGGGRAKTCERIQKSHQSKKLSEYIHKDKVRRRIEAYLDSVTTGEWRRAAEDGAGKKQSVSNSKSKKVDGRGDGWFFFSHDNRRGARGHEGETALNFGEATSHDDAAYSGEANVGAATPTWGDEVFGLESPGGVRHNTSRSARNPLAVAFEKFCFRPQALEDAAGIKRSCSGINPNRHQGAGGGGAVGSSGSAGPVLVGNNHNVQIGGSRGSRDPPPGAAVPAAEGAQQRGARPPVYPDDVPDYAKTPPLGLDGEEDGSLLGVGLGPNYIGDADVLLSSPDSDEVDFLAELEKRRLNNERELQKQQQAAAAAAEASAAAAAAQPQPAGGNIGGAGTAGAEYDFEEELELSDGEAEHDVEAKDATAANLPSFVRAFVLTQNGKHSAEQIVDAVWDAGKTGDLQNIRKNWEKRRLLTIVTAIVQESRAEMKKKLADHLLQGHQSGSAAGAAPVAAVVPEDGTPAAARHDGAPGVLEHLPPEQPQPGGELLGSRSPNDFGSYFAEGGFFGIGGLAADHPALNAPQPSRPEQSSALPQNREEQRQRLQDLHDKEMQSMRREFAREKAQKREEYLMTLQNDKDRFEQTRDKEDAKHAKARQTQSREHARQMQDMKNAEKMEVDAYEADKAARQKQRFKEEQEKIDRWEKKQKAQRSQKMEEEIREKLNSKFEVLTKQVDEKKSEAAKIKQKLEVHKSLCSGEIARAEKLKQEAEELDRENERKVKVLADNAARVEEIETAAKELDNREEELNLRRAALDDAEKIVEAAEKKKKGQLEEAKKRRAAMSKEYDEKIEAENKALQEKFRECRDYSVRKNAEFKAKKEEFDRDLKEKEKEVEAAKDRVECARIRIEVIGEQTDVEKLQMELAQIQQKKNWLRFRREAIAAAEVAGEGWWYDADKQSGRVEKEVVPGLQCFSLGTARYVRTPEGHWHIVTRLEMATGKDVHSLTSEPWEQGLRRGPKVLELDEDEGAAFTVSQLDALYEEAYLDKEAADLMKVAEKQPPEYAPHSLALQKCTFQGREVKKMGVPVYYSPKTQHYYAKWEVRRSQRVATSYLAALLTYDGRLAKAKHVARASNQCVIGFHVSEFEIDKPAVSSEIHRVFADHTSGQHDATTSHRSRIPPQRGGDYHHGDRGASHYTGRTQPSNYNSGFRGDRDRRPNYDHAAGSAQLRGFSAPPHQQAQQAPAPARAPEVKLKGTAGFSRAPLVPLQAAAPPPTQVGAGGPHQQAAGGVGAAATTSTAAAPGAVAVHQSDSGRNGGAQRGASKEEESASALCASAALAAPAGRQGPQPQAQPRVNREALRTELQPSLSTRRERHQAPLNSGNSAPGATTPGLGFSSNPGSSSNVVSDRWDRHSRGAGGSRAVSGAAREAVVLASNKRRPEPEGTYTPGPVNTAYYGDAGSGTYTPVDTAYYGDAKAKRSKK